MLTRFHAGPKQFQHHSTNRLMLQVVFACVPGILIATWFFGYGLLINIGLAVGFAYGCETLALRLRRQPLAWHLADNSVLVTAVLFALTIPPGSPWWLVLIGIAFAVLVAKHAFGGLGQNLFNPAMCGYLLLLLAFPLDMTTWHIPNDQITESTFSPVAWQGLQQSLLAAFPFLLSGQSQLLTNIDGLAMATPLIEFKMAGTSVLLSAFDNDISLFDRTAGTGWELTNIAYLCGGIYLLGRRIISWHIPLSIIATVGLLSGLFYSPNSFAVYGTPYLHLFGSATMLGAFFIATDPVSAASTIRGKIFYGVIIGCSIYSIRVWGSYLDSVAIAVLFGNCCAPLLDYWNPPRIYGHPRQQIPQREANHE